MFARRERPRCSARGTGQPARIVETEDASTIADGVAVRVPIPDAVHDMHGLVDDVVLVSDDLTTRAMELIERHAGIITEPAGALGIAAILANRDRSPPASSQPSSAAAITEIGPSTARLPRDCRVCLSLGPSQIEPWPSETKHRLGYLNEVVPNV